MDLNETQKLGEPLTEPADDAAAKMAGGGTESGCCGGAFDFIARDLDWACEVSHEMMMDWLCPCLEGEDVKEKTRRWFIMLNPFYWLCWAPLLCCVLSGKWTHWLFGQSEGFEGETKLEREVRIQWVYTCDGPMMLAFLADLYYVVYYAENDDLGWNNDTLALVISMALCLGYIAGNVQLAHAMQNRHPTNIKIMIGCNIAFATGLGTALVWGWFVGEDFNNWDDESSYARWVVCIEYSMRAVVVIFVLLACYIYWPLFHAYDDKLDDEGLNSCCVLLPVVFVMLLIWTVLCLLVFANYDDFWSALT